MTPRRWGRWLAGLLGALLALGLGAGAVLAVGVLRSLPRLDEPARLPGLIQPVQVRRDAADVTHLQAAHALDAWRALGWVHAQERGWQLELNRRIVHGELSELLGPATLETDRLLRVLDLPEAAGRQYAQLPVEVQAALQAYADGINAFHDGAGQGLPPEFTLLRTRPGRWTAQDCVGWSLVMALDLGGNWGNELARLALSRSLPTDRLWQLLPPYPGEPPATAVDLAALYRGLGVYRPASAPAPQAQARPAGPALAWGGEGGLPEALGSNNWVVDGAHSASGRPLLANDPHLGLSVPSLWYMARLQAPDSRQPDGRVWPGMDVIGATLPGLPFVVLGRTARVAWGTTNTGPDVQDLYLERIHPEAPGQYQTPEGWAAFVTHPAVIKVRGQPDVHLTVRRTRHGPVVSDAQAHYGQLIDTRRYVLALRWSALETANQTLYAGLLSNRARSVDELMAAQRHWHSPMQNVVAADVDGHVAYRAAGVVPLRRPDNDLAGIAPAPGWEARYDWAGWLSVDATPRDDPAATRARGWIATANQRITPPGYPHFLGQDWHVPERYERISQWLAARPVHDPDSMRALQGDVYSAPARRLWPWLREALAGSRHPLAAVARAQFQGFEGQLRADQAAPLIFALWADELTRGLIAPRLEPERFAALYGKRQFRATVEAILTQDDAWWCAPLRCAEHPGRALTRALDRLAARYGRDPAGWRWGDAHPALNAHRPFSQVPGLSALFEVRQPSGGDNTSVNVGQYWANDPRAPFASRHAASLRTLFDLADPERSQFILPTGQSGLVWSPRYGDMAPEWAQGRYRPLQLQPAAWAHAHTLRP